MGVTEIVVPFFYMGTWELAEEEPSVGGELTLIYTFSRWDLEASIGEDGTVELRQYLTDEDYYPLQIPDIDEFADGIAELRERFNDYIDSR